MSYYREVRGSMNVTNRVSTLHIKANNNEYIINKNNISHIRLDNKGDGMIYTRTQGSIPFCVNKDENKLDKYCLTQAEWKAIQDQF